jgi:hypothetical protein
MSASALCAPARISVPQALLGLIHSGPPGARRNMRSHKSRVHRQLAPLISAACSMRRGRTRFPNIARMTAARLVQVGQYLTEVQGKLRHVGFLEWMDRVRIAPPKRQCRWQPRAMWRLCLRYTVLRLAKSKGTTKLAMRPWLFCDFPQETDVPLRGPPGATREQIPLRRRPVVLDSGLVTVRRDCIRNGFIYFVRCLGTGIKQQTQHLRPPAQ